MINYKIKVAYDGRRYKGWKHEKGDSADKSIQGKLERILYILYKKQVDVIGAVHTYAGVHAFEQVANFKAPNSDFSKQEIKEYIEEYLSDDIVLVSIEEADEQFQSKLKAQKISYTYRLWKVDSKDVLLFDRHLSYRLTEKLDVDAMQRAAEELAGKHDFAAFTNKGKNKKTIRDLSKVVVEETDNEILIHLTANSFLVNMERFIIGTLIQIGLGQKDVSTVHQAFTTREKEFVGHKVMAHSLFLTKVEY